MNGTMMIFGSMLFLGFSCSIGCGSVSSSFILGSQIGGEDCNVKSCMRSVMEFSLGKIISLSIMGFLSSIFGMIVLDFVESVYPNSTVWIVRGFTCLLGISILYKFVKKEFMENKEKKSGNLMQSSSDAVETIEKVETVENSSCGSSCSSCSSCPSSCGGGDGKESTMITAKNSAMKGKFFWAGLLYATIPCGPLVACLTYASTMGPILGTLLLASFGVVNSIVPVCVHAAVIGQANTELTRDTPYLMKPLKVLGGGLLIYVGLFVV